MHIYNAHKLRGNLHNVTNVHKIHACTLWEMHIEQNAHRAHTYLAECTQDVKNITAFVHALNNGTLKPSCAPIQCVIY